MCIRNFAKTQVETVEVVATVCLYTQGYDITIYVTLFAVNLLYKGTPYLPYRLSSEKRIAQGETQSEDNDRSPLLTFPSSDRLLPIDCRDLLGEGDGPL